MRFIILFLIIVQIIVVPSFAQKTNIGDVLVKQSFGGRDLPDGWNASNSKFVTVLENAAQVDLPSGGADKNVSITKRLDVKPMLGTRLKITTRIRAENVAAPPNHWNGVKAMLVLDTPTGKLWLQKSGVWGTFDWKDVTFNATVPEDTTAASFVLGLENTTGKVQFQNLQIAITAKKRPRPNSETVMQEQADKSPVYTGHKLPRLRGAMISPGRFGPEDIKVLSGEWKANHIRWQLCWAGFPNGPADTATVEEFYDWIDAQCKLLDAMLPECEKYGVYVCLDLHTPPGGRMPRKEGSIMRLFHEKQFQDAFVAVWQKMARRYKDQKMIWSYDLLNEPVEGDMPQDKDLLNWRELALKTAKEIRKIDPETAIVIEGEPWGGPEALEWFEPFDPKEVANVVYSAHMYIPHNFTHQGVYESPVGLVYPGEIGGKHWDKAALRQALRVPIEFARDYGVHMYIGEFSAIRWAPDGSAYRYLKDCIEIFEEEGWDWAYHAFREWDGWSVEHGPDMNDHKPTGESTDREKLLRSWFEKNER